MNRIAKISRIIRGLLILIGLMHLSVVGLALFSDREVLSGSDSVVETELNVQQRVEVSGSWSVYARELEAEGFDSVLILVLPELLFYLFIYMSLFKLFGFYRQGLVFAESSVLLIRRIGICVLAWPLFSLLYPVALTLILRGFGWAESLPISLALGSSELISFLSGLIIFVIGWIMSEARAMQQEQELTI